MGIFGEMHWAHALKSDQEGGFTAVLARYTVIEGKCSGFSIGGSQRRSGRPCYLIPSALSGSKNK